MRKPQDEPVAPHDQIPSFADIMMLVFSGPLRLDELSETEGEAEGETGEIQGARAEDNESKAQPQ